MSKIYLAIVVLFLFIATSLKSQQNDIFINNDIQLRPLSESLYAHITWVNSERWGRFSNNGALYIKNGKALLIDTPMDTLQTAQLVSFIKDSLNAEVTHFIPGHYHEDCVAGLPYLHSIGVKSFGSNLTVQKCSELNIEAPQTGFEDSLKLDFEDASIIAYYMGGGHTIDNIVVYFRGENTLFGGCFVKSNTSRGIGNLRDATVEQWPESMRQTKAKFGDVKIVIPGHGPIEGPEQFDHTLQLLESHLQKNK